MFEPFHATLNVFMGELAPVEFRSDKRSLQRQTNERLSACVFVCARGAHAKNLQRKCGAGAMCSLYKQHQQQLHESRAANSTRVPTKSIKHQLIVFVAAADNTLHLKCMCVRVLIRYVSMLIDSFDGVVAAG